MPTKAKQFMFTENDEKRFWDKVDIKSDNECWEWKAGLLETGRGAFWVNGKQIRAHRFSYETKVGHIPEDMLVCHVCDNGKCVNPNHLFVGTYKDNTQDMIKKGRKITLRGENDPKSKLTLAQAKEIYSMCKEKKSSQYKIGKLFNVSRSTVLSIWRGDNWKEIARTQ